MNYTGKARRLPVATGNRSAQVASVKHLSTLNATGDRINPRAECHNLAGRKRPAGRFPYSAYFRA